MGQFGPVWPIWPIVGHNMCPYDITWPHMDPNGRYGMYCIVMMWPIWPHGPAPYVSIWHHVAPKSTIGAPTYMCVCVAVCRVQSCQTGVLSPIQQCVEPSCTDRVLPWVSHGTCLAARTQHVTVSQVRITRSRLAEERQRRRPRQGKSAGTSQHPHRMHQPRCIAANFESERHVPTCVFGVQRDEFSRYSGCRLSASCVGRLVIHIHIFIYI